MNRYEKILINGQEFIYDLDPNLIFSYTKDQFEYIYTSHGRELTEVVTAQQMIHKVQLTIQSVLSCRNSKKEPILVVIATDKNMNNLIFCYYIMEKLLVRVKSNQNFKGEISKASVTQDPFNVHFRNKVSEEMENCYGLVIGTLAGNTDFLLLKLDEFTMEATLMSSQPIKDKKSTSLGHVTAIHILPPDQNDTRMGHCDPQILLGYSRGSILIYRYRAKIYSYNAPRLRLPINLSEFTDYRNYPITLLSCVRSYNSLAMTVAFSQDKPEGNVRYADSSPYVKLIETQGDLSRKQLTVLYPSDPSAVILEANLLLTELTTNELDSIIQLDIIYQNKFSFELNIWDLSPTQMKWKYTAELDQGTCYALIHRRSRLRSDDLLAYYKNTPQRLLQGILQYQKAMTTDSGLELKRKAASYEDRIANKRTKRSAANKVATQSNTDENSSTGGEISESESCFDVLSEACSTVSEERQVPESINTRSVAAGGNIEASSTVSSTEDSHSSDKETEVAESAKNVTDMVIDELEDDPEETITEETTHTVTQEITTETVTDVDTDKSVETVTQSSVETSTENVLVDDKSNEWTLVERTETVEEDSTAQTNEDASSEVSQQESYDLGDQSIQAAEPKSTDMQEDFELTQEHDAPEDLEEDVEVKDESNNQEEPVSEEEILEESFTVDRLESPEKCTVEQDLVTEDAIVKHEDFGSQDLEMQEDTNTPGELETQEDTDTPEDKNMQEDINTHEDDNMQEEIEQEEKANISENAINSQDEPYPQCEIKSGGHIDMLEASNSPEAVDSSHNQNSFNEKDSTIPEDIVKIEKDTYIEDNTNSEDGNPRQDDMMTQDDISTQDTIATDYNESTQDTVTTYYNESTQDDIAIYDNNDTDDGISAKDGIDEKYVIVEKTNGNAQSDCDRTKDDVVPDEHNLQDDPQTDVNAQQGVHTGTSAGLNQQEDFVYIEKPIGSTENDSVQTSSKSPELRSESLNNNIESFGQDMEEQVDTPTNADVLSDGYVQEKIHVETASEEGLLNQYNKEPSTLLDVQLETLMSIIQQANTEKDSKNLTASAATTEEHFIQDPVEIITHNSSAVTTDNNEQVEIIQDGYIDVNKSAITVEDINENQDNLNEINETKETFNADHHSVDSTCTAADEDEIMDNDEDDDCDMGYCDDSDLYNSPTKEDEPLQSTATVDEGEEDKDDTLQDEGSICEDRDVLSDIGSIHNSFIPASNIASPDTTTTTIESSPKVDYIPVMQQDLARLSESSDHSSDQNAIAKEQEEQRIEDANQVKIALEKAQEEKRIEEANQVKIALEKAQEDQRIEEANQAKLALEKAQEDERIEAARQAKLALEKAQEDERIEAARQAKLALEKAQEDERIEAARQAKIAFEKAQEEQRIEAARQAKIAFEKAQEEQRIEAIRQSKQASEKEFSILLHETIKIRDIDTFMKMPLIDQDQIDEIGLSCWYTPDARVKLLLIRYLCKHSLGKMIVPLCKRIFDAPNDFTEEETQEYKSIYKKYIKEYPSYNEDINVFTSEGRQELIHKELNRFKFNPSYTSEEQKKSFQKYMDYYGFGSNLMSLQ
ncbi:uncharacterized protein EV154DRAFT_600886 [Mucor mucedo]|uniref:uncharacterized protein n=1 Tax=Mucor mucedo TaxID=29922 RepID=UPI00221F082E|nr:uncharacterized protein EV154DRAFT_600886 [Mucor mucedo]KAI7893374.1 hypothetical protein EV154DRAFT_600886 [Mucor mucedo]